MNAFNKSPCLGSDVISVDLLEAFRRSENQPEGWTEADVQNAAERYRRFLLLAAKHDDRRHAPTRDIDVMWHLHMLHPRAYFEDCMRLFGRIFDHDGGFGKGKDELPQLLRVFESTSRLWQIEYGEPYVSAEHRASLEKCWHDCESRCWHACQSK